MGKVAGVKLRIHWTFVLLIIWVSWIHSNMGYDFQEILLVLGFVLTIFVCVILHELGHATAAKKYNIETMDITILPIGGLARLEKMPDEPGQELWIAVAGPLVNVVIAGILFLVLSTTGTLSPELLEGKIRADNFLLYLMSVNIFLVVFNLIPAFPMDGGRIFRALLSFKMNRLKATKIAAAVGQVIAVFFVLLGLFSNPFLIFIGIVVYLGAQMEAQLAEAKFVLSDYKVKDVMLASYSVLEEDEALSNAVKKLLNEQSKEFLVMRQSDVVGVLTRDNIIQGLAHKGKDITVSEVMNRDFKTLNPEMSVEEVYTIMQQDSNTMLPVVSENELKGALDMENIVEFIMVQSALQENKENGSGN